MINVAVVGSGYWGKNLVRNFDELGALHTICDKNIATLRSFRPDGFPKKFMTAAQSTYAKLSKGRWMEVRNA